MHAMPGATTGSHDPPSHVGVVTEKVPSSPQLSGSSCTQSVSTAPQTCPFLIVTHVLPGSTSFVSTFWQTLAMQVGVVTTRLREPRQSDGDS